MIWNGMKVSATNIHTLMLDAGRSSNENQWKENKVTKAMNLFYWCALLLCAMSIVLFTRATDLFCFNPLRVQLMLNVFLDFFHNRNSLHNMYNFLLAWTKIVRKDSQRVKQMCIVVASVGVFRLVISLPFFLINEKKNSSKITSNFFSFQMYREFAKDLLWL